jgi:lipid-A-disaccharide synthase-like uncharacterized protein
MKVIGWAGTALVVAAYYPQIRHLLVERCAWGLSLTTWFVWLVASALLLIHCLARRDWLFMIVQSINIAAIVTTILLARRSNRVCPYHAAVARGAAD